MQKSKGWKLLARVAHFLSLRSKPLQQHRRGCTLQPCSRRLGAWSASPLSLAILSLRSKPLQQHRRALSQKKSSLMRHHRYIPGYKEKL
jgi:hypothetical protein